MATDDTRPAYNDLAAAAREDEGRVTDGARTIYHPNGDITVHMPDGTVFEFEVFDGRGRQGGPPSLTLTQRGQGILNRAAWEALGRPARIKLGYEREQRLIGVKAADATTRASYRLAPDTRTFSLVAFCNYFDIPRERSLRFAGRMTKDGFLAFALDGAEPVRHGVPRRRRATDMGTPDVSIGKTGAPYTEYEIARIRRLLGEGKSLKLIAAALGRTKQSVWWKINGAPALFALYRPEQAEKEAGVRALLRPVDTTG